MLLDFFLTEYILDRVYSSTAYCATCCMSMLIFLVVVITITMQTTTVIINMN